MGGCPRGCYHSGAEMMGLVQRLCILCNLWRAFNSMGDFSGKATVVSLDIGGCVWTDVWRQISLKPFAVPLRHLARPRLKLHRAWKESVWHQSFPPSSAKGIPGQGKALAWLGFSQLPYGSSMTVSSCHKLRLSLGLRLLEATLELGRESKEHIRLTAQPFSAMTTAEVSVFSLGCVDLYATELSSPAVLSRLKEMLVNFFSPLLICSNFIPHRSPETGNFTYHRKLFLRCAGLLMETLTRQFSIMGFPSQGLVLLVFFTGLGFFPLVSNGTTTHRFHMRESCCVMASFWRYKGWDNWYVSYSSLPVCKIEWILHLH